MGNSGYDFIAINRLSYEKELLDAISRLDPKKDAEAIEILNNMLKALRRKDPCAKKTQEISS